MSFLRIATQTGFMIATGKLVSDLYDSGKKKLKEHRAKNKPNDDETDRQVASVTD